MQVTFANFFQKSDKAGFYEDKVIEAPTSENVSKTMEEQIEGMDDSLFKQRSKYLLAQQEEARKQKEELELAMRNMEAYEQQMREDRPF